MTMVTAQATNSKAAPDTRAKNADQVRNIVLLGGTGDVGTRLTRLLLENTSAAVTSVSRRPGAKPNHADGRLRHVCFDLAGGDTFTTSADVVVVNLSEATSPSLARKVIGAGGWFLETSATPGYLDAMIEALDGATGSGGAILCVGAAPGLTNLMAAEITANAPETVQIDIGIEMGMGRHYGFAGTEWFLRTAGMPYPIVVDHAVRAVVPGQLKRKFLFREGGPLRQSIGYGFAEQTVIAKTPDQLLKTVRSFVALEPAWLTRALVMLLALGLGPTISRNARSLTRWLLKTPAFGQAHSRLVVEGFDEAGQVTGRIRLETGDQAEATAATIFATIQSVLDRPDPGNRHVTTITDHLRMDTAIVVLQDVLPETRMTARFGPSFANPTGVDV